MTKTSAAKTPTPLRSPSAAERQLSGALMAGAFALMCVALATIPPALPGLTPLGRGLTGFASLLAAVAYLVSIFFGGRGWVGSARAGIENPFNLQAAAGISGFVLHAAALVAMGLNGAADRSRDRIASLEAELISLKAELRDTRALIAQAEANAQQEVHVTCAASPPEACVIK